MCARLFRFISRLPELAKKSIRILSKLGVPGQALSGSGPAEIRAPAAPSREGSSQRAPGHAGASVDAGEQASGAAQEHAAPTMPGRGPFLPVRHTRSGARAHQVFYIPPGQWPSLSSSEVTARHRSRQYI